MGLKRPKLTKRESSAPASSAPSSAPSVPHANVDAGGAGINVAELNRALGLGGGGSALASSGISTGDLGYALSAGNAGNNRSGESTRHTSYPLSNDLTGLPAKAGTRTGPRTTSYRIPLARSAHSNIYDSVN